MGLRSVCAPSERGRHDCRSRFNASAPDDANESPLDERLDEALDETFPASDPVRFVHRHKPTPRPATPAAPTPKEK